MLQFRLIGMRAFKLVTFGCECGNDLLFHCKLCGPANLVRRLAQVPAGDQQHLIGGD
jgi:hypothetical protein